LNYVFKTEDPQLTLQDAYSGWNKDQIIELLKSRRIKCSMKMKKSELLELTTTTTTTTTTTKPFTC